MNWGPITWVTLCPTVAGQLQCAHCSLDATVSGRQTSQMRLHCRRQWRISSGPTDTHNWPTCSCRKLSTARNPQSESLRFWNERMEMESMQRHERERDPSLGGCQCRHHLHFATISPSSGCRARPSASVLLSRTPLSPSNVHTAAMARKKKKENTGLIRASARQHTTDTGRITCRWGLVVSATGRRELG